jgi:hypothetical protein
MSEHGALILTAVISEAVLSTPLSTSIRRIGGVADTASDSRDRAQRSRAIVLWETLTPRELSCARLTPCALPQLALVRGQLKLGSHLHAIGHGELTAFRRPIDDPHALAFGCRLEHCQETPTLQCSKIEAMPHRVENSV